MNSSEIIGVIEKFFLDIIGTVLPGATLIIGVDYVIGQPLWNNYLKSFLSDITTYKLLLIIAISYILGHAVTSFGVNGTIKLLEIAKNKYPASNILKKVKSRDELSENMMEHPILKSFINSIYNKIPHLATLDTSKMRYNDWRSLAMSLTQEHSHLVYRFMFIALLNLGIASVLLIMYISGITISIGSLLLQFIGELISIFVGHPLFHIGLIDYHISFLGMIIFFTVAIPFVFYLFIVRYYYFYGVAMRIPISMAYAKLEVRSKEKSPTIEEKIIPNVLSQKKGGIIMKVYLAGGFKSGWQDKLISTFPSIHFFDPSKHNIDTPKKYTLWDLEAIRSSDCLFAYLEKDNPGGYALALEVGFAKALGKLIIFVDEKSSIGEKVAKYLTMIAESSDVKFDNLQDGINYLRQIGDLRNVN